MKYKVEKPYPKVEVEKKNLEYAFLLLEDYAGVTSENTASHLYAYQSLIAEPSYLEYSKIVMEIAQVEMTHLNLLGKTIKKLGQLPVYGTISSDKIPRLWTAGSIKYNISLKEMLQIDIVSELEAIKNYQRHLVLINDQYIKKLIERIIEDEKLHLTIFKTLYQKYFNQ